MQKPIIPLTLAYITGLLLGNGFLYFPYSTAILIILSILTAGALTRFDKLSLRNLLLIAIPGIIGVTAFIYSAAWFSPDHYTRAFTLDKAEHGLTGVIMSPLDRDPDRTGFVLDLRCIDTMPVSGKVRVSVRDEHTIVGYGDTIRISGKLFEPRGFNNPGGFDYPAYLAQSGVYWTVSVKNFDKVQILEQGRGIFRTIQDWRERIRQSFLASTAGSGSAILQAMVIGEEGRLTEDLRDLFMAAGVTHIISISGSHLGMVAVLCFGLLRSLMFLMPERSYHRLTLYADPKKIAAWLTLPLVVFYTLLAGGQVATVRSLVMITAGLLALVLDRENALMHSLSLAALFILIASPQAIFDISFQLSFLSVLVIGYVATLWNGLGIMAQGKIQKLRNSAILLIIISLATSLATGPLVAHYFNQFSFAGIISNIIVVPFAGMVVVPLGLFSGILSLFTSHMPPAGTNQLVCDAFVSVVAFFARLPFSEFHPPAPGVLWLVPYMLFISSLAVYTRERLFARFKPFETSSRISKGPVLGMTLSGVLLILLFALHSMPVRRPAISFPDVGQGDCSLIELPSGKTILIDGGGAHDNRFDIGRRVLAPYLWNKGVRGLDLVILSHPHPDHMNGLLFVLKKFNVAEIWDSGLDTDLPGHADFKQAIISRKIRHTVVTADDPPMVLGEAEVKALHPARGFTTRARQAFAAENDRSLLVQVKAAGKVFLFTGDIGLEAEKYLVRDARRLKSDLVKVPHHGSKSSSSDAFVSATRPEVAVVTVGKGNPYRHPSDLVLARYEKIGTRVYRTDIDGAVTIRMAKSGLNAVRWNDLMLMRIDLQDRATWGASEWGNGNRLLIRAKAL